MVYPIADTEKPALLRLPFGAYLEQVEDCDSNSDRWLQARLADGTLAWIQRGDVEKLHLKNLTRSGSFVVQVPGTSLYLGWQIF